MDESAYKEFHDKKGNSFIPTWTVRALAPLLSFRYRYEIINREIFRTINRKNGVLLLCNHTSLWDGIFVASTVEKLFAINRPVVVDTYYDDPFSGIVLRNFAGIPIPEFTVSSNDLKERKLQIGERYVVDQLEKGTVILYFPSGTIKKHPEENLEGSSGLHRILQMIPPEVTIILVRISGMWGSSYSYGYNGDFPNMKKKFFVGSKIVLKNFLFFVPKRQVKLEFEVAPADFPCKGGSRTELNRYLENWFNLPFKHLSPPGEPRVLVPYYFWKKSVPSILLAEKKDIPVPNDLKTHTIFGEIQSELARISSIPPERIHLTTQIENELGLDSLAMTDLLAFMEKKYDLSFINGEDISTVADAVLLASRLKQQTKATFFPQVDQKSQLAFWNHPVKRRINIDSSQTTIEKFFLETAFQNWKVPECVDRQSPPMTYGQFVKQIIDLATALKVTSFRRMGILLANTTECLIVVLACCMAKIKPFLINWSQGGEGLEDFINKQHIDRVLTSKWFINELNHYKFGKQLDLVIIKEELTTNYIQKLTYKFSLSRFNLLVRSFELDKVNNKDVALFFQNAQDVKGITHEELIEQKLLTLKKLNLSPGDIVLTSSQPWNISSFCEGSLAALLLGYRLVSFSILPYEFF